MITWASNLYIYVFKSQWLYINDWQINRLFCKSFKDKPQMCLKSQQLTFSKVNRYSRYLLDSFNNWLLIHNFQLIDSTQNSNRWNKWNIILRTSVNLLICYSLCSFFRRLVFIFSFSYCLHFPMCKAFC